MLSCSEKIRQAFDNAAVTYDALAGVQRMAAEQLIGWVAGLRSIPTQVLDLGCGTGSVLSILADIYPSARYVGLDLSFGVLSEAQRRYPGFGIEWVQGDFKCMPDSIPVSDLVISNMALHWGGDISATVRSIRDHVRPGGHLVLSCPVAGTFSTLPDICRHRFLSNDHLRQRLESEGYVVEDHVLLSAQRQYPSLKEAGYALRDMGVHTLIETHCSVWARAQALRQAWREAQERGVFALDYVIGCYICRRG